MHSVDRKNLYFKPTIVGLHGDEGVTLDKADLNYWESLQSAVYPSSLFEVSICVKYRRCHSIFVCGTALLGRSYIPHTLCDGY